MYSVVQTTIEWLESLGFAAYSIDPPAENAPDRFVTVQRPGGYVADKVDHPSVAIQCWAPTDDEAEDMAIEVRNHVVLGSRPAGVWNMTVNSGPYDHYDEDTRCPRYQLYVDMTCQLTD